MAKAVVFNGKRTDRKMKRKHCSQMSLLEKNYLALEANKLKKVEPTSHAQDKMNLLEINTDYINSLLGNITKENIIEYNTGRGKERRVVILDYRVIICEDGKEVYAKYSIDIDTGELVTVWVNLITDKHPTLDMSIYTKNLKIF